jgi:hypothetical protein
MSVDGAPVAQRPLTARSKVTNGRRTLEGVDGRSASARRFRDLLESFSAEYGGVGSLNETTRALIRQAASLTIRAEQLQAAIVRGEPVDPDELIRLTNTTRRTLAGIRRKEQPKVTLSGYLANKRGTGA